MLSASGNLFKCHEEVLYLQPLIPPKRFDIFPPITGGCSEGLGVLYFSLNTGRKNTNTTLVRIELATSALLTGVQVTFLTTRATKITTIALLENVSEYYRVLFVPI